MSAHQAFECEMIDVGVVRRSNVVLFNEQCGSTILLLAGVFALPGSLPLSFGDDLHDTFLSVKSVVSHIGLGTTFRAGERVRLVAFAIGRHIDIAGLHQQNRSAPPDLLAESVTLTGQVLPEIVVFLAALDNQHGSLLAWG